MTLLEQLQADILFYLLNILGFLVVVVVTWLLTRSSQAKALAELERQKKQTNSTISSNFIIMQDQINHEQEYLRRCTQLLEKGVLEENINMIRQQRYQLIYGLMQNYRPKVAQIVQFWMYYYKEDKEQQQAMAKNIIIPFLETCRQVIGAVNSKAVLNALPKDTLADQAFVAELVELNFAFKALETCGRKRWAKQYQKTMALEAAPTV